MSRLAPSPPRRPGRLPAARAAVAGLVLFGCDSSRQPMETVPPSLLAATAPVEPDEQIFKGCQAAATGDGAYDIRCDLFALEVEPSRHGSANQALEARVKGYLYGDAEVDESETTARPFALSVDGARHPGRRFRRTGQAGSAEVGFLVAASRPDGSVLVIACSAGDVADRETELEEACRSAMSHIVRHGVPAGLVGAKTEP